MNPDPSVTLTTHREQPASAMGGWPSLLGVLVVLALGLILILVGAGTQSVLSLVAGAFTGLIGIILIGGFFTLQPNEAAVFTLFGAYRGTARQNGFLWANPFYRKLKISLRARNLNGDS
jgi:regulator of protease activity HflC (stomatin/prohibitin superfamily)